MPASVRMPRHAVSVETGWQESYGQAYVPEADVALTGLREVNREFVSGGFRLYQRSGRPAVTRATLEIDASFMETQKKDALRCYKKFDAYSSLIVRWADLVDDSGSGV